MPSIDSDIDSNADEKKAIQASDETKLHDPTGVKWNNEIQVVIFVPSLAFEARDKLWWRSSDFHQFKSDVEAEVRLVMKEKNIDQRSALKLLYQPDEAVENTEERDGRDQFWNGDGDVITLTTLLNYRPSSPSGMTRPLWLDDSLQSPFHFLPDSR